MDRYGDYSIGRHLEVGRVGVAERRFSGGYKAETISSTKQLTWDDYEWLSISNTTEQNVILPDATTNPNYKTLTSITNLLGWSVVIYVPETSGDSVMVQTYSSTTPVDLKQILTGRAYRFTCVDASTPAGVWHINYLEEADLVPSERYTSTFDATTSWGAAAGGYYTITVTAATHGRGTNPEVTVLASDSSDWVTVSPDRVKILANGDVQIRVPETPDLRFAGKILFL